MKTIDENVRKGILVLLGLVVLIGGPVFLFSLLLSIALLLGVGADVGPQESTRMGVGYLVFSAVLALVVAGAGAGIVALSRLRHDPDRRVQPQDLGRMPPD